MRGFASRHPVVFYYVLAAAMSWAWWLWMFATGRQSGPGLSDSHLPGLLGPLAAALVVTRLAAGTTGVRELVDRMLRWPARPLFVLTLILAPLVLFALVLALGAAGGAALPRAGDFTAYPGIPAGTSPVLAVIAVLVLNGFGEEVGWRGFMLEKLSARHGAFAATLIIVPFWALWHWPVFLINTGMTALIGPALIGWLVGLACGAFVLSYIYFISNRSILAVALWHTAYNFAVAVPAATGTPAAIVSTVVMVGGLYAAWWLWKNPQQESG